MAKKKTHSKKKAPIGVKAYENDHGTITRAHTRVAEVNADEIAENQERASSAAEGIHAVAAGETAQTEKNANLKEKFKKYAVPAAVGLATVGIVAATAPVSAGPALATVLAASSTATDLIFGAFFTGGVMMGIWKIMTGQCGF